MGTLGMGGAGRGLGMAGAGGAGTGGSARRPGVVRLVAEVAAGEAVAVAHGGDQYGYRNG